jgi:hypothetical protein
MCLSRLYKTFWVILLLFLAGSFHTKSNKNKREKQKAEVPSYTTYILFTIKDINRATCFDPAGSSSGPNRHIYII